MFRWGFIGSVGISEIVAKEITKNDDIKITAVYSKNFSHALKFAEKYNAKPYSNFDDMIKEKNFYAIYVAVPHYLHYHFSKIALENNIPVLCEKPLTLNEFSSQELFNISQDKKVYFSEAMWTWYNPTAYVVKKWLDDKQIGKVKTFKADFTAPSLWFVKKPRLFDPQLGGGSLFDIGVYPICYAYKLFGYPNKIYSRAKMRNNCDIKCEVIFEYDDGKRCVLTSGFHKLGRNNAVIKGEYGKIKLPFLFYKARKATLISKKKCIYEDKEKVGLYEREFLTVQKEIENNQVSSGYMSEKDSMNLMKILETIKKQINLVYPDDKI